MKCEIAQDLIPMYVEGMCSEKTVEELESHIKKCKECQKKIADCKTDIELMDAGKKSENGTEQAAVNSMKKVKKKLTFRKVSIFLLSLLLVAVLGVTGVLCYGEWTGASINFTTINDVIILKKLCKEVCNGNLDPLLDRTYMNIKIRYVSDEDGSVLETDELRTLQRERLQKAIEKQFGGKPFKYRIDSIEYAFLNNSRTGVSEDLSTDMRNPAAGVQVAFYNEESTMFIYFTQMADRKYAYYNSLGIDVDGGAQFSSLSCDDTFFFIFGQALERAAQKGDSSARIASFLVRYTTKDLAKITSNPDEKIVRNRVGALYEKGYNITEFMYEPSGIERENYYMTYHCLFRVENKEGDYLIFEQKFLGEGDLYIMNGEAAKECYSSEGFPEEIKQEALALFAPVE